MNASTKTQPATTQDDVIERNELVIEVRFKAVAEFLDTRGECAEHLRSQLNFNHWSVQQNAVRLYNQDDKTRLILLSHKNALVAVRDSSKEKLVSLTQRFFGALSRLNAFGRHLDVIRIGSRCKLAVPFDGSFSGLVARIGKRYIAAKPELFERVAESGKIDEMVDVAHTIIFRDEAATTSLRSGPMRVDEFKAEFGRPDDEFPEVGLLIDVDRFSEKPVPEFETRSTPHEIESLPTTAWRTAVVVKELVIGDAHLGQEPASEKDDEAES